VLECDSRLRQKVAVLGMLSMGGSSFVNVLQPVAEWAKEKGKKSGDGGLRLKRQEGKEGKNERKKREEKNWTFSKIPHGEKKTPSKWVSHHSLQLCRCEG
jgi:hypothetical protein